MITLLQNCWSLLAMLLIWLAAYRIGTLAFSRLLSGSNMFAKSFLESFVWSMALGMVLYGAFLTTLGMCFLLYIPIIWATTIPLALWSLWEIAVKFRKQKPFPKFNFQLGWNANTLIAGAVALGSVACLAALITSLAPPTDGDALCYHLQLPKVFLQQHYLVYLPYGVSSTYPLLVEIWFLWALALDGPVSANLMHWSLGVLLILSSVGLARCFLSYQWSWLVGAVVALVPGVTNQMTVPLNDVGVALFTTLAFWAWHLAVLQKRDSANHNWRWIILVGVMLGAALSIKYTAIIFAVALVAIWLIVLLLRFKTWQHYGKQIVVAGMISLCFCSVWYARAAWHTGNPVFPCFAKYFESTKHLENPRPDKRPLGTHPLSLLQAPWQITMQPDLFGGRGHQLGAIFLVSIPLLIFLKPPREMLWLLGVACCYGLLCCCFRQNVRFLLMIVPLLAIPTVFVWQASQRMTWFLRPVMIGVLALLFLFETAISVRRSIRKLPVALGIQSREDYLLQHEPTYEMACFVNDLLPSDANVFSQEQRAYYFQPLIVREHIYRLQTNYQTVSTQQRWTELTQQGYNHILLVESENTPHSNYVSVLDELLAHDHPAIVINHLKTTHFTKSDGQTFRYQLLKVKLKSPTAPQLSTRGTTELK